MKILEVIFLQAWLTDILGFPDFLWSYLTPIFNYDPVLFPQLQSTHLRKPSDRILTDPLLDCTILCHPPLYSVGWT